MTNRYHQAGREADRLRATLPSADSTPEPGEAWELAAALDIALVNLACMLAGPLPEGPGCGCPQHSPAYCGCPEQAQQEAAYRLARGTWEDRAAARGTALRAELDQLAAANPRLPLGEAVPAAAQRVQAAASGRLTPPDLAATVRREFDHGTVARYVGAPVARVLALVAAAVPPAEAADAIGELLARHARLTHEEE